MKEKVVDTMSGGSAEGEAMVDPGMASEQPKSWTHSVGSFIKKNAVVIAVGVVAASVTAGMLIPRTRTGIQKIGPMANHLGHRAMHGMSRQHG